jgi:hypothetical protein
MEASGGLVRGKEDEKGKIPHFDTIELTEIAKYLEDAQKEGKFVLVADMHGQCHSFMTYSDKWVPFEFGSQVKKCDIQKTQSHADASEAIRKSLVFHMNRGTHWTLHVEKMIPMFEKYNGDNLPLKDFIFKREKLFSDYKTLLKPGEDKDLQGNAGMYNMHKDFNIVMLADAKDEDYDDEILQMLLDAVYNVDEWKCVFIKPEA